MKVNKISFVVFKLNIWKLFLKDLDQGLYLESSWETFSDVLVNSVEVASD